MKNPEYKASITFSKGGKQFINIISSAAFSSLLVVIIKQLTDKDFQPENIQSIIDNISGSVLLVTPVISSIIKMISNYAKHIKAGLK